jgi:hypothetical protein
MNFTNINSVDCKGGPLGAGSAKAEDSFGAAVSARAGAKGMSAKGGLPGSSCKAASGGGGI